MNQRRALLGLFLFLALVLAGAIGHPPEVQREAGMSEAAGAQEAGQLPVPTLTWIQAIPLHRLLPFLDSSAVLEASGVVWTGKFLVVAFDNLKALAVLQPPWTRPGPMNRLVGPTGKGKSDFEGLAYDEVLNLFFLVREAKSRKQGVYARIHEWNGAFQEVNRDWVRLPFGEGEKGYEGLAFLRRGGGEWLLALRETAGGEPVDSAGSPGLIDVLAREGDEWVYRTTIQLPAAVRFQDYAGLDVRGHRLVVLSQASARVWIGRLHPRRWEVAGPGEVYALPAKGRGHARICRAEGICWLDSVTLAVVTDWQKEDPPPCTALNQHLLILRLP